MAQATGSATAIKNQAQQRGQILLVRQPNQQQGGGQQQIPRATVEFGYIDPARITQADLQASNGVAQVVDHVFLPPPSIQAALQAVDQTDFLQAAGATMTSSATSSATSSVTSSATSSVTSSATTTATGGGFWRDLVRYLQGQQQQSMDINQLEQQPDITLFVPSNEALRDCYGSDMSQASVQQQFNLNDFVVQQQAIWAATTVSSVTGSMTSSTNTNTSTNTSTSTSSNTRTSASQSAQTATATVGSGQTISVAPIQQAGASPRQQQLLTVNGIPIVQSNILLRNGVAHVMDGVFDWVQCPNSQGGATATSTRAQSVLSRATASVAQAV